MFELETWIRQKQFERVILVFAGLGLLVLAIQNL